jgi:hypothetical protein
VSPPSAEIAAWYGAGLATVTGIVQLLGWWLDRRARLTLTIEPDNRAYQDLHPPQRGEHRFLLVMRNPGRQPVHIERVYLARGRWDADGVLYTDRDDAGTVTIAPGESERVAILWEYALANRARWVVVEDQAGKRRRARLIVPA